MAKAVSSTSPRAAAKKASAATSAQTRKSADPPAIPADSAPDALSLLTQRMEAWEEKLTVSLSSVVAEIRALTPPPPTGQPQEPAPDTSLPLIADLIRRSLTEHLTPITAALKRVEERLGFIGNRLKPPTGGGGPERQKPWRHDQPRHDQGRHDQGRHSRPRPHTGPHQGPAQPWSPPSAASVQGHFAPRQHFGGEEPRPAHEEEE